MDSIKEQMKMELSKVAFDDKRKQELILKVKSSRKQKTHRADWLYRTVLSSFVLLTVVLVILSNHVPDPSGVTQAEGKGGFSVLDLLAYDSVKMLIMASFFVLLYGVVKRSVRKKGREFPSCAHCGTTWNRKLAIKKSFKNEETLCPNCGAGNYQSRKSKKKTSLFQIPIPFMIIAGNVFELSILGIVAYLAFLSVFTLLVIPYYVELQLNDPVKEPWW
ncbi:TIGR04104 family putative zinc finger protein [Sporosarcina gallistercoris]|uniref:TIGR04104 family putative zinc finger protein n=1 Tax=Sporosarcina gallistercoris TaxID=2762245 RepID=UPI003D2E60D5